MSDDVSERCETCRFFWDYDEASEVGYPGELLGECHRYPPTYRDEQNEWQHNDRPTVVGCEWCGEYQQKEPNHER